MSPAASRLILQLFLIACVTFVFFCALSEGAEDFLMDVLKLAAGAFGGFGIGWAWAKRKGG